MEAKSPVENPISIVFSVLGMAKNIFRYNNKSAQLA